GRIAATSVPVRIGSAGRASCRCGLDCPPGMARCTAMAASASKEATSSRSASPTARVDDSIEGRSIESGLPGSHDFRDSRSRTWVSATKALRGLQRLFEQALDQQRRDLDRIRKPVLVDELEAFARQVVLLVAEVREARRRNAFLVEGERIDPLSRRADAQIVTVTEAELLRETGQPIRERLWRGHQLEAV